jgi:hypothetical protein
MRKAYIHLYNQYSTNLKNDLEAATAFAQVESAKDPIGLLKLIQGLCCSYDSKTQSVMATVASHKKLFTFFQRDGVDNSSYHREFIALVETIETYGGMVLSGSRQHLSHKNFKKCMRPVLALMLHPPPKMNWPPPTRLSAKNSSLH